MKPRIGLKASSETLKKVLKGIDSLTKQDYSIKLGSLLKEKERKHYTMENFKIPKLAIKEKIYSKRPIRYGKYEN